MMANTTRYSIVLPLFAAVAVVAIPAPAQAQPYGPDTCIQGFVWREARPGDTVCVTPDIRTTVAQQNGNAGANKDPNAGSGPESCSQGYVWREAFNGDTICVTPAFRQQMFDANGAAASASDQPACACTRSAPAQNPLCGFRTSDYRNDHPVLRAVAAPALAFAAIVATVPAPAVAQPDTCISGFVWREARNGDTVCVTPDMRATIAQQNSTPGANKDPNAGSGPQSCSQGYVWREAFNGDTICVTPDFRAQVLADNGAAASRVAANEAPPPASAQLRSVLFEVTGSGTVYSIDLDPFGRIPEGTTAPFHQTTAIGPEVSLLQVVVVTKSGSQGCRITVDNTVVAEEAPGDGAHCVAHL